jgi:phosphatidylserine/phosphatidylglycerophosphate/cardiolipin synthase-like enzyme
VKPAILLLMLLSLVAGCLRDSDARTRQPISKAPAEVEDDIAVYFSPKGGALAAILAEIGRARQSIDVQAYLITSKRLVDALEAVHVRGVRVRIVLDKRNPGGIYTAAAFLSKTSLPVWRDGQHKDEHDKVILIDGEIIITGSFNFTDQSEEVNAENMLIIRHKPRLFAAYLANFETHLGHSDPPKKP